MTEETEYVCPECGADLPANAAQCPGCGLEFASGADGEASAPDEEPATPGEDAGGEGPTEIEATLKELTEVVTRDEAVEKAPTEEPPPSTPSVTPRKGFFGTLSVVGLVFLALAALAVVGTVVLMHWDVWVQGASGESVGDRQRLYIYLGMVGVVVCAVVSAVDILKRRK